MRNRNNKIISELDGVLTIDVSTDKHPDAAMLINKNDWIRVKLYEDVGRFSAFKNGRTLYAKANIPGGGYRFIHHLVMQHNGMIDHINRNGLDNQLLNLRKCDKSSNGINIDLKSNNTSGVTGVWYNNPTDKWCAEIRVNYKKKCLGSFIHKEDAIKARKKAEKKYFGEFA